MIKPIILLLLAVLTACCYSVDAVCHGFPRGKFGDDVIITVSGEPSFYVPSSLYTVQLHSRNEFTDFMVTSESNQNAGSFQLMDQSQATFSERCINTLVASTHKGNRNISFHWSAPSSACVTIRGAVHHKEGWSQSNKTFCPFRQVTNTGSQPTVQRCCACDHAKYKVILEGLWSAETHARDFPTTLQLTHFSDLIGASHTPNFTMWREGGYSTYGFRQLAEYGVVREIETELRNASMQLRNIIKAAGLWYPNLNGNTSAVFRVDPRRHLLSLASMFGPSPDWFVGVSSLDLCQSDCTWLENQTIDLYPYDAGTDDGISYMSVNSPTEPAERIRAITTMYPEDPRSPFYDPRSDYMPPLARLYLQREKLIDKPCSHLTDTDLMEQVTLSENTEEQFRPECSVTDYSEWSECSVSCGKGLRMRSRTYTDPVKAVLFQCDRQLTSKEMCVAQLPLCPGEDEEEEEIEGLAGAGECDVTAWSDWSDCSVTCGIGFIMRTRTFTNSSVAVMKRCIHVSTTEKEKCMLPPCKPQDSRVSQACSNLSEWSDWSPCSVTCGSGYRTRIRRLLGPSSPHCRTSSFKQTVGCKVNRSCQMTPSQSKQICSLDQVAGPCRGDFKRWAYVAAKEMCLPFNYGGCRGNANNFESEKECLQTCSPLHSRQEPEISTPWDNTIKDVVGGELESGKAVDCVVSKWSSWSGCQPCPRGRRNKTRSVLVRPANGGKPCPPLTKVTECIMPPEFCYL